MAPKTDFMAFLLPVMNDLAVLGAFMVTGEKVTGRHRIPVIYRRSTRHAGRTAGER
jgi:hypothetical protein